MAAEPIVRSSVGHRQPRRCARLSPALATRCAIRHRCPAGTRVTWWWSHNIPTIAYPMHAHTDLAKRVGYPPELFDVTGEASLERSLRAIAGEDTRRCLLHAANRGGELSSPQVSPGLLLSWLLLLLLLLCIDMALTAHVRGRNSRACGSHQFAPHKLSAARPRATRGRPRCARRCRWCADSDGSPDSRRCANGRGTGACADRPPHA